MQVLDSTISSPATSAPKTRFSIFSDYSKNRFRAPGDGFTSMETKGSLLLRILAMILSLAAVMSSGEGALNSSLDPFDSSTLLWSFPDDNSSSPSSSTSFSSSSSSSSSSASSASSASSSSSSADPVRTLTPDLRPASTALGLPRGVSPWDAALCVTGTLVACENALVIAVLVYTPALRAPMFVLMGSLAAADLLAGLGLVLHFACAYLLGGDGADGAALPLLSVGLLIAAFSASVLHVLAVTVDRYLSLCNALTYHTERTLTCTYVAVAAIWAGCLVLGLLPALGWNCLEERAACSACRPVTRGNAVALASLFLLVFAAMTQLYLQICRIAFRHAQQIAVQHQFLAVSTTKGVSTLSAILCAFGLCWLPFALYSLVADGSYPAAYTYAAALPAAAGSFLNPVIYAFRNPDVQKSLWLACCGCLPANLSLRARTSSDV